jgi:murein DD-endopeptidase MepM/ murein hydrolase activator NlpD
MKKLYYYSKSRLQFIEIKNYKVKLTMYFIVFIFSFTAIVFGSYTLLSPLLGIRNFSSLEKENNFLQNKLERLTVQYKFLSSTIDSLNSSNNDLRIAVNLEPLSDGERQVGVGGGYFDNSLDFLNLNSQLKLDKVSLFADEISRKLEFEKTNYLEIVNKLKENKKLYESIPAIKPCQGIVGVHGFGMRSHPILNIRRMHDGIDIITKAGTPIYASGKGTVDFVGYRGGLGLTIEIDHGFGYRSIYGHLSATNVKIGEKLSRGKLIAKTGNSGLSSGPHLHYEIHHNGVKQNPVEFFFDDLNFFELTRK